MFINKTDNLNIVIAGGRDYRNYKNLEEFVDKIIKDMNHEYKTVTIISGMAQGADMLGVQYSIEHKYALLKFPANWQLYGKRAGFIRNKQMLDYLAESQDNGMVIAFWDGQSSGTKHTIYTAREMKIPCFVCKY